MITTNNNYFYAKLLSFLHLLSGKKDEIKIKFIRALQPKHTIKHYFIKSLLNVMYTIYTIINM